MKKGGWGGEDGLHLMHWTNLDPFGSEAAACNCRAATAKKMQINWRARKRWEMKRCHPNVLNTALLMTPDASTSICKFPSKNMGRMQGCTGEKVASFTCNFITSPQAGAPTSPVPTDFLDLSRDPTYRIASIAIGKLPATPCSKGGTGSKHFEDSRSGQ